MSKEYIRDKGRVRLCASNIAKMNVFESIYYHRYRMFYNIVEVLKEFFGGWRLWVSVLIIPLLPIVYPIMAYLAIRNARKEVDICNKDNA